MSVSPRAATLSTPSRGISPPRPPRSPAAGSAATHRHSSSTLSSCRLLDCTPWAPAAASRLRLLLRLLPPAAARRPDKRAKGGTAGAAARGARAARRGTGAGVGRAGRAKNRGGSGADARHSAGEAPGGGAGRRARPLRSHGEGGAQLRTGAGISPEQMAPAGAGTLRGVTCSTQSGGANKRTPARRSESGTCICPASLPTPYPPQS